MNLGIEAVTLSLSCGRLLASIQCLIFICQVKSEVLYRLQRDLVMMSRFNAVEFEL